jgi:hypothetical protein
VNGYESANCNIQTQWIDNDRRRLIIDCDINQVAKHGIRIVGKVIEIVDLSAAYLHRSGRLFLILMINNVE